MNYCGQCGSQLLEGSRFCGQCGCPVAGLSIEQIAALEPASPESVPRANQAPPNTPYPQTYMPAPVPAAASQPQLPVTGSHLPFLFAISGCLTLLATTGLILFLTVGLASTISKDQLADMGLDCELTEMKAKDLFAQVELQYDVSGNIDAQKCEYSDFSYHLYVITDYRGIYNIISEEICSQYSLTSSLKEHLESLEELFQEVGSNLFQSGQYVFQSENSVARGTLEDLLRENDIQIHEEEMVFGC